MLHHSSYDTRGKRIVQITIILLFVLLLNNAIAENIHTLSFRQMAEPSKGVVPIYIDKSTQSQEIVRLEKGIQCEIIGMQDPYFRVRIGNQTGYALKSMLTVQTIQASVLESLCSTVSLLTATPSRYEKYLMLQGNITADEPLETLFVYIWDERQQQIERTYIRDLDQPASQIDATILQNTIPLSRLKGGRKMLVVEGTISGKIVVLYRTPVYICGDLQEPAHVTGACRGLPQSLEDRKISTVWTPRKNEPALTVQIPEQANAAMMTLEWEELPESFTVELIDENGQVLKKTEKKNVLFMESIPLTDRVRKAVITPLGVKAALASVRVYREGYPTLDVQEWEPLPDKIDILLISTHQDDEFLFFGGSIPYYAARDDVTIGVLYMTDCGRSRYQEALNGLWCAGLRHHPIFLGLEDFYTTSIEKAKSIWVNDDPGRLLVRAIRQYKPEVILCHDFNGEYGHAQHKYTAQLVTDFFSLAADADYDPQSVEQWGTWQIKKCYVHLYEENQIRMDWNKPLDDTGIITPMFLAWEGYDKSKSQLDNFSMERDGKKYDNSLFGLYWSAVGPDVEKDDFMENVR